MTELQMAKLERDAAFQALGRFARKAERLTLALQWIIATCGEHIEGTLSREDARELFDAIDDAKTVLTEDGVTI